MIVPQIHPPIASSPPVTSFSNYLGRAFQTLQSCHLRVIALAALVSTIVYQMLEEPEQLLNTPKALSCVVITALQPINLFQQVTTLTLCLASQVLAQASLPVSECFVVPTLAGTKTVSLSSFQNFTTVQEFFFNRTKDGVRVKNYPYIAFFDSGRLFQLLKISRPLGFDSPLKLARDQFPSLTPEEKSVMRTLFYIVTERYFSASPFCTSYTVGSDCSSSCDPCPTLVQKSSCAPPDTLQQIGFDGTSAGKEELCGHRNFTLPDLQKTFLTSEGSSLQPYTLSLLNSSSLQELYNMVQLLALNDTATPLHTLYTAARSLYNQRSPKCEYDPCATKITSNCFPRYIARNKPPTNTSSLTSSSTLTNKLSRTHSRFPLSLSAQLSETGNRTHSRSQIRSESQTFSESFSLMKVPAESFGSEDWNRYFGDVGVVPPLPWNITDLMNSPCPIWGNQSANTLRVMDTHLLTLIPQTVNGTLLTLTSLGTLMQNPRGGNKTQYRYFNPGQYNASTSYPSHWVLFTRDVIPGTRAKSYAVQQQILHNISGGYEVPLVLDAAVALAMYYVRTGMRLYNDNPWTWTRCQEKWDVTWQVVVGGFAPAGLYVCNDAHDCDVDNIGLGGRRKFS